MKENSKPVSSVLQSKSVINKEIYGLKQKAKKQTRRKMERMKETRAENLGEEFGRELAEAQKQQEVIKFPSAQEVRLVNMR